MTQIRRILLVLDPSLSRTPAVDRAQALARHTQAELWLGLFDRGSRLGLPGFHDSAEGRGLEGRMRDRSSARLLELQAELAATGLRVQVIDDREHAGAERIAEQIRQHEIDLVIKDVGHESALRRLVFLPLDWEILRSCPVPVWMAGSAAMGLPRNVVAAVDPLNPEHGSGPLNDAILGMARALADPDAARLRVFTAFAGVPTTLQALDPIGISINASYEELHEDLRRQHRCALTALLQRQGLGEHDAVVLFGPPVPALLEAIEDNRPDVLVVGTIRRRGIDRLLMGSTVERLVGQAPCDIIAVPVSASNTEAHES